jgi:hypothetical protein
MLGDSLYSIFEFLEYKELVRATSVSKQFNKIARRVQLYRDRRVVFPCWYDESLVFNRCKTCNVVCERLEYNLDIQSECMDCLMEYAKLINLMLIGDGYATLNYKN